MSNKYYPKGAEKILGAQINFSTHTIKAALVPSGYTYSDAHEFLAALGTLVGTPVELASKTITGGVFDADNLNFGALTTGSTVKAVVLYRDTGSAATSPLIAYLDEVTGLPYVTNGGELTVPWSDGSAKILALV